jgi:lipopolysaccharide export system protein LptC
MTAESRHSLFMIWAKVVLPLMALVLLSTLFLFSGRVDPTTAALSSQVDVGAMAREPRLTAPEYSGMTADGSALTMRASTATPDPQGSGASASNVIAKIESRAGQVTDLTAKTGRIDSASGQITLSDGVAVQTSSGYRMATSRVEMATDSSSLLAPQAVQAESPFGTINAGSMQMGRENPKAPYDLLFKGRVKLIYQPEQ